MDQVLAKDESWRDLRGRIDALRTSVNRLQREVVAPAKKAGASCDDAVAETRRIKDDIADMEARLPRIAGERDELLNRIGNVVDPEVPISDDEDADNLVVALYPEPLEAEDDAGGGGPSRRCSRPRCPSSFTRYRRRSPLRTTTFSGVSTGTSRGGDRPSPVTGGTS